MLGGLCHVSDFGDRLQKESVPFLTSCEEDFRKTRAFWRSSTRLMSIGGPCVLSNLRLLSWRSSGNSMITDRSHRSEVVKYTVFECAVQLFLKFSGLRCQG